VGIRNRTSNRAWWLEQAGSIEDPERTSRRKFLLRGLLGVFPTLMLAAVVVAAAYFVLVVCRYLGFHISLQSLYEAARNLLGF